MGTKKYKSVFILHVYQYDFFDAARYRIDKNTIKRKGYAMPGCDIFESERGIFESLSQAEKVIKRLAKTEVSYIYSFLVEEKPVGGMFYGRDAISRRRYMKDGTLWQKCDVSDIRCFSEKYIDLGETGFYGRDPKTIPFKEGDIVEVAGHDFVQLAIIWKQPPSIEQMKNIWEMIGISKKTGLYPNESEDAYTTVSYNVDKNGEINYDIMRYATVDVLPTDLPVSRKIAADLRRSLKKAQADGDEIPF